MTETGGQLRRLPLDPLLLGLYTWLSTVAVPAFALDAPPHSRWLGITAIVPLVVAWWIAGRFPLVADYLLGVGFVGLSVATWLTLGHAQLASNLAELRTAIGAVAWALLAVAWVRARQSTRVIVAKASPEDSIKGTFTSLGFLGAIQLGFSLLLVVTVFWGLGLPSGDGRGALVTSIAIGWSIWTIDISGLLAARLEHQSKGLGAGLLKQGAIWVALGLAGVGFFFERFAAP